MKQNNYLRDMYKIVSEPYEPKKFRDFLINYYGRLSEKSKRTIREIIINDNEPFQKFAYDELKKILTS
jgi:hypothetical protein